MNKLPVASIIIFVMCVGVSFAESRAERYEKAMSKYEQTETFESCIRNRSIKRTTVLDDRNIIFEMRDKKVYLNTLSHQCRSLGFSRQFAYSPRGNRLCDYDFITVFDSLGPRISCGLGKFELLEKRIENND